MDTLNTPFDAPAAQALAAHATALIDPLAPELQARSERRAQLLAQPADHDLVSQEEKELLAHPPQLETLLEALPEVPVLLCVRTPKGQETDAVAQAWARLKDLSESMGTPVSEYDSRLDEVNATIRVNAHPNLVLALVQEQDYFWSVALDKEQAAALA